MKHLSSILALFLLAACMPELATPAEFGAGNPSWLDYTTCDPPCWLGITPGGTTLDEAVSILEDQHNATDIYISELPSSTLYDGAFSWVLPDELAGESEGRYKDGMVTWMRVSDYTCLSELIPKYGEPTHVTVSQPPDGRGTDSTIFWLDQGFQIYVSQEAITRNMIDDSVCSYGAVFFIPAATVAEVRRMTFPVSPVEWHGYDTFDSYLPENN